MNAREILRQKAIQTLRKNMIKTPEGLLLAAGGHQFRTLWVRDFCYSVPGLLQMGQADLVEKQIRFIVRYKCEDGLLPRGFDVLSPKLRVLLHTVLRGIPLPLFKGLSGHSPS